MTYEEKKKIADKIIGEQVPGMDWDSLSDTNSLHDAETKEDIEDLCRERLEGDGFVFDEDDDDEDEDFDEDDDEDDDDEDDDEDNEG